MTDTRKSLDHERDSQVAPTVRSGEIAHTPGPWVGERVHGHDACVYVEMANVAADEESREVAVVYARRFGAPRSIERAKADARLIAAAPDMLAALHLALDIASSTYLPHPDGVTDPKFGKQVVVGRDAIRAAIAKATMTAPQSAQSPLSRETGAAS